jgi:threonine dehydrogenase-like Zn-dependent dehydrogenase
MCTSPIAAAAREVIMPTVKQLAVIAIAIAAAIVGAGTVGLSAIEHSATQEHSVTQVLANRFTPSKADFRLNDPQRLRKILLGQKHIELPLR